MWGVVLKGSSVFRRVQNYFLEAEKGKIGEAIAWWKRHMGGRMKECKGRPNSLPPQCWAWAWGHVCAGLCFATVLYLHPSNSVLYQAHSSSNKLIHSSSWPTVLRKAPLLNTVAMGTKSLTHESWGTQSTHSKELLFKGSGFNFSIKRALWMGGDNDWHCCDVLYLTELYTWT